MARQTAIHCKCHNSSFFSPTPNKRTQGSALNDLNVSVGMFLGGSDGVGDISDDTFHLILRTELVKVLKLVFDGLGYLNISFSRALPTLHCHLL